MDAGYESGYVTYKTTQTQCGPNPNQYFYQYTNFNYYDSSGTAHPLTTTLAYIVNCPSGNYPPSSATLSTTDGPAYLVTLQAYYNGAYASSVVNVAGTKIVPNGVGAPGSGQITDRNGNYLSFSTTSGTLTFTDTLGTTALTIPSSGAMTYKNPQGTDSSYTPTWTSYPIWTSFGCSGVSEYHSTMTLLTSLALPDGSSYSFTYEPSSGHSGYVTGRIASVTLPTGGTISYQYSGGSNGINCTDGSTPTLTRITPDGTWTYARSGSTTTITDPQTNQTSIAFQGLYEVQRNVYQGSVAPANLLKTVDTCYNGSTSPCTTTAVSLPIAQVSAITTLPGTSTLKSQTATLLYSNGLPYEVDEYDYGPNVGSLIRKTITAYASLGNNIQNQPSSITVQNPTGGTVAQTTFTYDESGSLFSTTGTPHLASVSGARGNATTIKSYTSATLYLTRSFTYFDTGNVRTATDVTGAVTTYNYGTGISCGNSFVTSATVTGTGLPTNPALSTSATWDTNCYGAVQRTATGANGDVTTTNYTDNNIWRPTSVVDPANASTSFTYTRYTDATHPASVESALNFATSSTVDNATTLDGLGRAHISQRKQSQSAANYDSVETDYDSLGRPSRVTVPYSDIKSAAHSGGYATTTTYDALGRPLRITDGGGGWTNYTYDRNDVLVEVGPQVVAPPAPATENTKKRQLQYDALGRLTSVCELTTGSGSGACSQTATQTGYWTKYTYNELNRLTGVTQNAQATYQTRTYQYDWLGRMTQEQNPESGTSSYSYDSDSTCGATSYNGDLVKRTDAVGNVTCYQHDLLHRVTAALPQVGSPYYSQTPQKHYVYDQSASNGSMGRLGHAYTCPSSSNCSTWTTDLGFVYSARGELTDVYELAPHSNGGYYHVSATYWANGLINTLNSRLGTLPTWTYNPEGEGRASAVTDSTPQTLVAPTSYNLYGLPTGMTFGSTDYDSFQYDATGRMTQFAAVVRSSSMTGVPTWNTNGSLQQLAINDGFNANNTQTCTDQHDDLARIAAVNCGSGKWNQSFSYGSNGFGNVNWTGTGLGTNFTAAYNAGNNHFASLGTYDSNGNLLTDGTHTYTWDADGNLYQVGSTTMTYDALGRRVEQAAGTAYTEIVYGPGGGKLALVNGSTQAVISAFIPLPAGATAVYAGNTLSRYRHSDWLGSSRLSSTPTQPTSVAYDGAYSPMGESYVETGATDRNFTGQNEDLTTGSSGDLYDFAYREYHPIHGRWISPDPAGLGAVNLANPQSWNRYAYTNGSPLNSVDPLGLTPTCVKQGTCVGESIVRDISGAGIYGSLTFAGSMLGVQTLTLSSTSTTSTGSAPSVIFDVPTYNNDGSWASLDRQETQWSTSSTTTDPWGASLSWVEMLGGGTPGSAQTTRTASAGTCPAGQTRMPNGNCDKPFPGGQELANGIAKGAGPAASPCFWVEWTALAASAGGGTAVWVNRAVAVDLAKDAAIKLAASQIGKAGLNPKPGVLTALGAGWNWFNNSCVP